ncbi:MAG: DUF5013 domain-containing protein [Bacteroidaceae bacterium]|nr:DUF5013 domain-containing protein [Bacteroidaceae bacterium]
MKRIRFAIAALIMSMTINAVAQDDGWDREKYPDLPSPRPTVNMKAARKMIKRMNESIAAGKVRPDHINNALQPSFPPIINQSGGSCGAASSIYYQFTNQINTARFTAADTDERRYATHFPWMLNTNSPTGTGYDRLGRDVGIASVATYGGTTYSHIYGNSGQDDQDDDCGWMQGYDSWFATMHNRILAGNSFPFHCGTEEGRELVKNYLWNRCGDDSYASGGICGIGVAAGPFEGYIPKTEANEAAGVTGMKYITDWNETYNHAMTIVGYDDRVEFDLDGNGVIGEERNSNGDNEVGAWIICNSWGDGYANNGFIYCPYEKSNCVKGWPKERSFTPGYYDVIRDYRPLRTLRVKMEYSHRSEISLNVGIAQDINATKPEKSITLTHFNYCGDGNKGKTRPAPEVPMLGRWSDGQLHTEPMEFGYDLTDLTADCDFSRPIKYFFWVETRSWGTGEGKIHEVSVIDYNIDRKGAEVPFPIAEPIDVPSAGKKTELTAVVSTDYVPEPRNLVITGTQLSWQAPSGSRYEPESYKIYHNGEYVKTVAATELSTSIEPAGSYTVSALYSVGGYENESRQSTPVAAGGSQDELTTNTLALMEPGSRIVIPDLSEQALENFTIEFWVWPNQSVASDSYGFRIKADTTQFFFKITSGNLIEYGNDGGSYTKCTTALTRTKINHIAIVNSGLNAKLYINGILKNNWSNSYGHYGIKGPSRLVIGETEGTSSNYKKVYAAPWNGYLDEFRFWKRALTASEVKASYTKDVAQPRIYGDLLHYYNMRTRVSDDDPDQFMLVDACGNCDGEIVGAEHFSLEDYALDDKHNPITTDTKADFTAAATAVVGKPFSIQNNSNINTAQWDWTFTGADVETLSGTTSPTIVFNQAGEQTITLKTTTPYGTTDEKTATVNVEPAVMPTVDFTLPDGDIPAGTHVTFVNTSSPIESATYEWNIEGAENPVVKATNAGATFSETGDFTVTLTAYSGGQSASVSKTISVGAVAPEAAFSLRNNVVLKGESVDLIDESRFSPKQWTWDLSSAVEIYRLQGQDKSFTFEVPGIYDVTLSVANSKGTDQVTRNKAITVCNADGEHGLKFDGEDDLVTAASPFPAGLKTFTIEWWMFPGRITDKGNHIGDKASTFQLCTMPKGQIALTMNGETLQSDEGTIINDEWHHYAITFRGYTNYGTATFYRDGIRISSGKISSTNVMPELDKFTIGGTEQPCNAMIDELRVWNYVINAKDILPIANEPVADPASNEALLLYWDFNQDSGDVADRSANGITGIRQNFGPDGDAWENSLGIFCLNPKGTTADVTATYLKNYKHPFKTGTGTVNPANSSRYLKLLMNKSTSPWIQKNNVKKGSILTEWHVDAQKNNYLTLEDTYSGFEEVIKDLMIFQTVELPAGEYTFTADRDGDDYYYNWLTDGTYVAAAAGDELPVTDALATDALAWAKLSESQSIKFCLDEPTTVSLGLIANMSDKKCVAVGKFVLLQKAIIEVNGTDFDGVSEPTLRTEQSLQATGGLGCINIRVNKPQRVAVSDLSGKLVFRDWLDFDARIPAKRGIYVVNNQKVIVR